MGYTGGMLAHALLGLLALTAAAQRPLSRQEARGVLDRGLWNARIQALYDLGELGPDALPLLAYSSDDADWQVRLTAVHFLGKLGPAAAPALAGLVRVEACPNVRISALRWLSAMGLPARALFESVVTPEDRIEMEREPDRYGTERMGKPLVIDAPDGMTADFFNGGIDLRVCASSEHAGRLKRHLEGRSQDDDSEVVTAPVPVAKKAPPAAKARAVVETAEQKRLHRELDTLLAEGRPEPRIPESMPQSPLLPAKETPAAAQVRFEAAPPARASAPAVAVVSRRVPESMPQSPLLPAKEAPAPPKGGFATPPPARASAPVVASAPRRAAETLPESPLLPGPMGSGVASPAARFEADAGTGKPENDPIPFLIAQLSVSEPRRRARAADELGKRGPAARLAVPALRKMLSDHDKRVRASAVLALGNVGADAVRGDLKRALRDKDADVRFSAAIALERSAPSPR